MSQPGLLGGQILDGIDVLHLVNLLSRRTAREITHPLGFGMIELGFNSIFELCFLTSPMAA